MRFSFAILATVIFSAPSASWSDITIGDTTVAAFEELSSKVRPLVEPIAAVPQNSVTGQLINGVPVNPAFFPGIIRMTTGGTCTAAVVGPATILFAAHCVDHQSLISFLADGQSIEGICEQAPGFRLGNDSEDWALCLLSREIGGFAYESVNLQTAPAVGDEVILTGYGCTEQGGGIDGLLRAGVSDVSAKPNGWPDETSTIYTASSVSGGQAVLCPGDSGGPLFRFTGGVTDARSVVGVNSRTTFQFGVSLFAALASEAGRDFVTDWAKRHNQEICGFNRSKGCR